MSWTRAQAIIYAAAMAFSGIAMADATQDQFDAGKSLANKMMGSVNDGVSNGSTASNLQSSMPGYNPNPPEKSLYGNSEAAAAQAQTLKDKCASQGAKPSDPQCAGIKQSQVTVPKGTIKLDDPVLKGQAVANNPMAFLGNVNKAYSGCNVTDAKITTPATYTDTSCSVNFNFWASKAACNRTRTVVPKGALNCDPGQVIASQTVYRNGIDIMYAQAYCPAGRTDGRMEFHVYAHGSDGACMGWQTFYADMSHATSPTVVAHLAPDWVDGCKYMNVYTSGLGCPVGDGNCNQTIHFEWPGREGYDAVFNFPKPKELQPYEGISGCETYENLIDIQAQKPDGQPSLPLDQLMGLGAANQNKSYCTRETSVCVDGPSTKNIKGIDVYRACWQWANKYTCGDRLASSTCDPVSLKGCAQVAGNSCASKDINGNCTSITEKYQCEATPAKISGAATCAGGSTFCENGSCYDQTYTPNTGIYQSAAILEAMKQASKDFSASGGNPIVFVGKDEKCTDAAVGLLNCCKLDSFLDPVNPTPADLATIGCSTEEKQLAVDKALGKCHTFDSYCDSWLRVAGKKTLCLHKSQNSCCFGSKLVRIIHEQGRPQVGRDWGAAPENPDCSGLSIEELQRMDFAAMDFSEFTKDLKITLPDVSATQNSVQSKSSNCYYGGGKC